MYTTAHGLAHNYTYRCRQDSRGFLWVSTQNGLSRFDGHQFDNFFHIPGDSNTLHENDLPALAIDALDRIWVGGDAGISIYDQRTGKAQQPMHPAAPKGVTFLLYDSIRRCVWAAHEKGVTAYHAAGPVKQAMHIPIPLIRLPTSLHLINGNHLLLHVLRQPSWSVDIKTRQATPLPYYRWLTTTTTTADGANWLAGWGTGLYKLADTGFAPVTALTPTLNNYQIVISDLAEAPALTGDSLLWIIGTNSGKLLFDKNKGTIIHRFYYQPQRKWGTTTELHNSAYYSRDGILWVCSWMGLEKISCYPNQFEQGELPGLQSNLYNMLSGIVRHRTQPEKLWVGVHGSGIALVNSLTGQTEQTWFKETNSPTIDQYYGQRWTQSLLPDRQGNIWAGSYDGFVRIRGNRVSFVNMTDAQGSLYGEYSILDSLGWLWMTCMKGLAGYHTQSGEKRLYRMLPPDAPTGINRPIEGLATDKNGYKYAGGRYGLIRFREGLQDTTRLHYRPDGKIERIITVTVSAPYLIIGSESGIWRYHLNEGKGDLIAAGVVPVHPLGTKADDYGHIWMHTQAALVKINAATKKLQYFNTGDGIYTITKDLATMFAFEGMMYLGHRMAFTRWRPNLAGYNTLHPIPAITKVLVNSKPLPLPPFADTTWPPSTPDMQQWQFFFTALEQQQPEKISFAWRLHGYDSAWQATTNRSAIFTNLKAGTYTFEVQAFNSSGLAAMAPAVFRFEIAKTWYNRWWARLLAAGLITAAVATLVKWRERRIIRKAEAEKTRNKAIAGMQMATLRSQMNPHFIFNSLNSIQKFIWENKKDDASDYLNKFARLVRNILELSNHEMIPLKKELELLTLYIDLEHRRCNGSFEYKIITHANVDIEKVQIPPMLLQPFVENAIWHGLSPLKTKAGFLHIDVSQHSNGLQISITDNGIGRSEAGRLKAQRSIQKQSLGMQLTEQRMQLVSVHLQRPIAYKITNLTDNETETGTVVIIWI